MGGLAPLWRPSPAQAFPEIPFSLLLQLDAGIPAALRFLWVIIENQPRNTHGGRRGIKSRASWLDWRKLLGLEAEMGFLMPLPSSNSGGTYGSSTCREMFLQLREGLGSASPFASPGAQPPSGKPRMQGESPFSALGLLRREVGWRMVDPAHVTRQIPHSLLRGRSQGHGSSEGLGLLPVPPRR